MVLLLLCKVSDLNYLIETPGHRKSSKLCHVNLLKGYHSRDLRKGEGTPAVRSALTAAPVTTSCGFNFVEGGRRGGSYVFRGGLTRSAEKLPDFAKP